MPSLCVRNLGRRYNRHVALEGVDLTLRRGEILGVLGPNGAGKSTLMQMLSGNLAPHTGQIEILGINLQDDPVAAKAHLGYLPEIPPLYREMAVGEFLRFAAQLHCVPGRDVAAAVARAMEHCGLAGMSRRLIGGLSKGYQQRVGLAQAIIHDPALIMLDEPTVGLDPLQIREIRALIMKLGRTSSVILSTHLLAEAEMLCDRVMILLQGRMVFHGSTEALRHEGGLEEAFVRLARQDGLE